jgi:hypothetical protein
MSTQTSTTPLHFEVLKYLKTIQSRHGIAEEQHIRYRQYCTRRLHRVRTNSAIKLPLKAGKKYTKTVITPQIAKTTDHLVIPLLLAERAWAYANEDQVNLESPLDDNNGRDENFLRRHVTTRFRKSVQHAKEFETLCVQVGDSYTQLQAHFYSEWLQGVSAIGTNSLEQAHKSFTTCKNILTGLLDLKDAELTAICMERLGSINSYLSFCNSRLKRSGIDINALSLTTQDPVLLAKLGALSNENNITSGLESSNNEDDIVQFGNSKFDILNLKVKNLIIDAKELYRNYIHLDSESNENIINKVTIDQEKDDKKDEKHLFNKQTLLLNKLSSTYDNIITLLNQDLKQAEIAQSRAQTTTNENNIRQINGVLLFSTFLKFETSFTRHVLQLYDLMYKFDVKQAVTIKTIHVMIDRLIHIVQSGINLYQQNSHYFSQDTTFKSNLIQFTQSLTALQHTYTIIYYLSILEAQFKAFQTNSTPIFPKDFSSIETNDLAFLKLTSLKDRSKSLFSLTKLTINELTTQLAVSGGNNNIGNILGSFGLVQGVQCSSHFEKVLKQKIAQLKVVNSQVKVIYYSSNDSIVDDNNNNTNINTDDSKPALMDRLNEYSVGQAKNQYDIINLIPTTMPIPAKPFVFDTAYGIVINDNEYNQQQIKQQQELLQQQQQQRQQQSQQDPTQATTTSQSTRDEDAPKSFWSRLWG